MAVFFSKRENIVVKWIRRCSICISLICIMSAVMMDLQYPIWVLPLTHVVGLFLLRNRNAAVSAPGIVALNVVMFCRYELVPLSIYMAKSISKYAINTHYINQAVLLMTLELIWILLLLGVTGRKRRSRDGKMQVQSISQLFISRNKTFGFFVVSIVLIALAVQFPSLISGMGLIVSGSVSITSREAGFSGIVDMIWRAGLAWIYVYILSKIKDFNSSGKHSWVLLIVVTLVYILFTFILNLGISRWYSIVCFAAAVFLMAKLFPRVQRRICIWTIVPVFVVFVIVSVYKNTTFGDLRSIGMWESIVELFDVSTMDIYFAGPGCVNNGLTLYYSGKGGLQSLLLDTVRNMPVVNHYFDDSYSTVELYASMLRRGDMIIPLSIQSMIYFGAPLFGVLSGLAILLMRKMDEWYIQADNAMAFVYGFVAVWIGLIFVLNYTICISWFYSFIIPMGILFLLTTRRRKAGAKKLLNSRTTRI